MSKKIKRITMIFENCESIDIPNECIKKINYKLNTNNKKETITNLDCIIEDNGNIFSYPFDKESPIQRIYKYNDIISIEIIYEDNSKNEYYITWYDDGYNYQSNKNQKSEILRYNIIHIIIEPFIPTYTINQIFDFPIGTILQGTDEKKYTIYSFEDDSKRADIPMDMQHINMNYTVIKLGEMI